MEKDYEEDLRRRLKKILAGIDQLKLVKPKKELQEELMFSLRNKRT